MQKVGNNVKIPMSYDKNKIIISWVFFFLCLIKTKYGPNLVKKYKNKHYHFNITNCLPYHYKKRDLETFQIFKKRTRKLREQTERKKNTKTHSSQSIPYLHFIASVVDKNDQGWHVIRRCSLVLYMNLCVHESLNH